MTITQLLVDLKYGEDLLDSILSGDKDGDSDSNGINVGERDNASISNDRDDNNNASW